MVVKKWLFRRDKYTHQMKMLWIPVERDDSKILPSISAWSLRRDSFPGPLNLSAKSLSQVISSLVLKWGCSKKGTHNFWKKSPHWMLSFHNHFQIQTSKRQSASSWHVMWVHLCRALLAPGFAGGASGKEPTCQCRRHKRLRFNPWLGWFPGGGHGNPFQYSYLENPMDREVWWATVYRVAKRWTSLKRLTHAHTYKQQQKCRSL